MTSYSKRSTGHHAPALDDEDDGGIVGLPTLVAGTFLRTRVNSNAEPVGEHYDKLNEHERVAMAW